VAEGRKDPRGQVRRAAAVDELKQRVKIHGRIPREDGGRVRADSDAEQLLCAPLHHRGILEALAHIGLASAWATLLRFRPPWRRGAMPVCHQYRYHDGMLRVQAQLTEQQARRLKARAGEEGVSVAALLRRGADLVLDQAGGETNSDRRRRALDAVGRFADAADVGRRHDEHLDDAHRA